MSQKTPEDLEFQAKLAKAQYKTTYKGIGSQPTKIPAQKQNGINGGFTKHLITSGMPHNASLNTTADKARYVNGNRDWMQKLG